MKVLAIIDKFKGTISSKSLGNITKDVLTSKNHNVDYYSISDGGDGFLESINQNKNLKRKYVYVLDALSNKRKVSYLIDNEKAYIEVAKIIGKNKDNKLDIYNATTYGVGQVILHAINNKAKEFYIGLGGSITNDGGKGMLALTGTKKDTEFFSVSFLFYCSHQNVGCPFQPGLETRLRITSICSLQ